MKRIILSAVVGLALGAGSATAEITPVGEPFLDTSKSSLLLQEYKQGQPVTYLADFCDPLVPHLAEVFGDSRGEAWLTCLRTINAINEETPGWRNPDSIDSGQRMLLIWPGNFEEPYLSDLKERVAEIGKVNNLANDPRAMAAMLIAISNRGAAKLNDEQMRRLADDLEAAAVAAVKKIPESAEFLKMVQDAVNKNLSDRSETPVTIDLSGIESAIQANKNAIQANKNAIAALPSADTIATDAAAKVDKQAIAAEAAKLVQLSDADKANIAAQVSAPKGPTAKEVAEELDTSAIAQEASQLVKLPEVETSWWQTQWAYLGLAAIIGLLILDRVWLHSRIKHWVQRLVTVEKQVLELDAHGLFNMPVAADELETADPGRSWQWPVKDADGREIRLVKRADGNLDVEGIKGTDRFYKLDLKSVLSNIKHALKEGRIVGLSGPQTV